MKRCREDPAENRPAVHHVPIEAGDLASSNAVIKSHIIIKIVTVLSCHNSRATSQVDLVTDSTARIRQMNIDGDIWKANSRLFHQVFI